MVEPVETPGQLAARLAGGIGCVVGLSVAIGVTAPHWPQRWLRRDVGPLRLTRWETRAGYERAGIRRLKRLYPEGGSWAGGRSKSRLPDLSDPAAVDRYVLETRRAEWVHWLSSLTWLPAAWFAPWWIVGPLAGVTMAVDAVPIAIVRYNRLRLYTAGAGVPTPRGVTT